MFSAKENCCLIPPSECVVVAFEYCVKIKNKTSIFKTKAKFVCPLTRGGIMPSYTTYTSTVRKRTFLFDDFFLRGVYELCRYLREEEATLSGRLPYAFLQSLPSGFPL